MAGSDNTGAIEKPLGNQRRDASSAGVAGTTGFLGVKSTFASAGSSACAPPTITPPAPRPPPPPPRGPGASIRPRPPEAAPPPGGGFCSACALSDQAPTATTLATSHVDTFRMRCAFRNSTVQPERLHPLCSP